MILLDGKTVANQLQAELKQKIAAVKGAPELAVILVGFHAPSHTYVKVKQKACLDVGIVSSVSHFNEDAHEKEVLKKIQELNQNPKINGILLQSPLPPHMDMKRLIEAIDPKKDVDGFHPENLGKLLRGDQDGFIPCTPLGIAHLLEYYKISPQGKHVVILGRSNIVGKPMAALFMQNSKWGNATVTIAHSQTPNLSQITTSADILIAAIGKAHFINASMIKQNAAVIDVGINRVENGSPRGYSLTGDVDFPSLSTKASALTPVPGGVGPMTVAMLLHNTFSSFEKKLITIR